MTKHEDNTVLYQALDLVVACLARLVPFTSSGLACSLSLRSKGPTVQYCTGGRQQLLQLPLLTHTH